jgi:enoyl-CoA hydratase
MTFENVLVEKDGTLGVVTLNRPQALNALSYGLVKDLSLAMQELEQDPGVRVIIVTGGEKVFAAGADIKEMAERGPFDERISERLAYRDKINKISKPVIAAVSGFALGGGCELAMSCDIIIASETARFGQPEVNLGIIPGSGGTQRLTHLLGKHRAMELVLTGDMLTATDAERLGLVNRIVPAELLLEEAKNIAKKIAEATLAISGERRSQIRESGSRPGLEFERKSFYLLFALRRSQRKARKPFSKSASPSSKVNKETVSPWLTRRSSTRN